MSTSEPNKNAPPSPDDSGTGNVSSLGLLSGSRIALLPQAIRVSPGSQIHPLQPHVHASPPDVVCPASATELNGWGEWEVFANSGSNATSITTAQRQRGNLKGFIEASPFRDVEALRFTTSFRADLLFKLLIKTQDIAHLTKTLIRFAEHAYGQRNLRMLADLSAMLCALPSCEAQSAGLYYQAIILKRTGEAEKSQRILEALSAQATPQIQSRAIHTLAAIQEDIFGDYSEAARLHAEALRTAQNTDTFTLVSAQLQLSALKSYVGDHQSSLSDLQQLYPLVAIVARQHIHLWPLYHNGLAYELNQAGRREEAAQHSQIAMASPIALAYPEWQETAAEIAEQQPSKAMVAVALPHAEAEPTDADATEERPRLLIQHRFSSLRRLPFALPSPTLTCLLTCAPIRAPTARS
jgi:hypothetical protein